MLNRLLNHREINLELFDQAKEIIGFGLLETDLEVLTDETDDRGSRANDSS
jgi:hypothetical protein